MAVKVSKSSPFCAAKALGADALTVAEPVLLRTRVMPSRHGKAESANHREETADVSWWS